MSPETHDPELTSLAASLAKLAPSAGRLDRDQLLFRAGQTSAGQRGWLWPGIAALLAVAAGVVGLSDLLRSAPQHVQCVIYHRVEPPASPAQHLADRQADPWYPAASTPDQTDDPPAEQNYLRLQRLVCAFGADALPNPPAASSSGSHGRLLNALPKTLSRNDWLRMQRP
jgi:hypothetical protein